jgi:hypothetical protein
MVYISNSSIIANAIKIGGRIRNSIVGALSASLSEIAQVTGFGARKAVDTGKIIIIFICASTFGCI